MTDEQDRAGSHAESGDLRVWKHEYGKAVDFIDSGNVAEARRLLDRLAKEAPFEEIRNDAKARSKQFEMDWLALAFFGGSLLAILAIVIKYYY